MIPTYDEFDFDHYVSTKNINVYLVDHNSLDCFERKLAPFVRGILDHHDDKGEYDELLHFKDIRLCGAAVTLIMNHIYFDKLEKSILDP